MSKRKPQYDIDDDKDDYCLPQVGKIDTQEEIAQRRIIKISGPKQTNETQARIKTDFPKPVFARAQSIETKELIQKKLNEELPSVELKSAPQSYGLDKLKERMLKSPPKETPFSSRSKITEGRRIFTSDPENNNVNFEKILIFKARLDSVTIDDNIIKNASMTIYQIGQQQFLTSIQIEEEYKIKDQIILKKESKDEELYRVNLNLKQKEGQDGQIIVIQFSSQEDFNQFDNLQL